MATIEVVCATPNEAVPMVDASASTIIPLRKSKAKTGAQRARTYRQRKQQKAKAVASPNDEYPSSESLIPQDISSAVSTLAKPPAQSPNRHATDVTRNEDASSRSISQVLLLVAAFALAGVGISMNGWFARSLGSSEAAGWLFLAVGVAADLVALAMPSCAPPGFGERASGPPLLLVGLYGQ
jgi:hypothetical protein